jgi:hypothetical protein
MEAIMRSKRCLWHLACWLGLGACAGGSGVQSPLPSPRLFDPLAYRSLPGSQRSFGVRDGLVRSYFHRQGPLVLNLILQSGSSPSLITRFSGSDRGAGLWFLPAPADTELYAGAPDAERLAAGGGLAAVERDHGRPLLYGVRATLKSNAARLSTELVLLGRASTLGQYAEGACLEDAARFPELRNEHFELDAERSALRVSRAGHADEPSLELLLVGARGTRVALNERQAAPRPTCPLEPGAGQPIVELTNAAGIELEFVVLASDAAIVDEVEGRAAGR